MSFIGMTKQSHLDKEEVSTMPIYEYRCKACKHVFEKLVPRFESEVNCPSCGAGGPEKLLSVFSAHGGSASLPPCRTPYCSEETCRPDFCPRSDRGSSEI